MSEAMHGPVDRPGDATTVGERRKKAIGPLTHVLIATALFCLATVGYTYRMPEFGRFFAGENDFLPRYTQSHMVGTGHMYDIEAGYREQDRTLGFHIAGAYHDRLPWQALFMAPLGRLPYVQAYWLWIGINLACFAALVRIWLLPRDYVLWGIVFFPAAASVIVGQDGLVLALCIAGVLILANRGRDFPAGLLLALCTAKPHLFLLVPVALIARRRWKLLCGATTGTIGLLLIGTAAAGPDWLPRLMSIARVLGQGVGGDVARRPTVFQFGFSGTTLVIALLLAVAFSVWIWRAHDLEAGVALAMIGSVLIAPHKSVYDLPLLLVALIALPLSRYGHWLRIALLTPLPYWALLRGSLENSLLPLMLLALAPMAARRMTPNGHLSTGNRVSRGDSPGSTIQAVRSR